MISCKMRTDLTPEALEFAIRDEIDDIYRRGAQAQLKAQAARFDMKIEASRELETYKGAPVITTIAWAAPGAEGQYTATDVVQSRGAISPQPTYPKPEAIAEAYIRADVARDERARETIAQDNAAAEVRSAEARQRTGAAVAAGLQSMGQGLQSAGKPQMTCKPDPLAITPGTLKCQ